MSRFIPSSKHAPCPICGDTQKKCRSKEDEGKLFVLCMTVGNASKGEVVSGFKCVNPNGKDAWGSTWVEATENDENYSPEAAQKHRQQREKAERRHQAFLRSGLRRGDRSLNVRKLSEGLGLTQEHRRALQGRGLSNEAINKGYFFSVTPGQFVPKGIDARTPGVSGFGNKLAFGQTSLACPAFDTQGNIIGYQLRLDEATEGKYRWAKGKYPSHLCNGELPLTVARPVNEKASRIGLCEGILKPYIAAQIHQKIFVGASGANFASSPEQLKLYLAELSRELETKELEFYPDAGSVSNTHVIRSYRKIFDLLESFGYDIRVAWWGQAKKEDRDCDEIAASTPIQLLSLSDFEDICIQHGGYIPAVEKSDVELTEEEIEQQRKEEFYRRVVATQRPLRTLSYKPDLIFTPEDGRYLPNLVGKVPESGIVLLKACKGTGKSHAIRELKDYLCHGWKKTEDFANKTPVIEFIDGLNKRFNSTTPRIALGREQSIRWCYTWLGDIATEETTIDGIQANRIAAIDDTGSTFDSFWKLQGRDFSNTLWVLDECELGLSHLALSSTLKGKRPLILRLFVEKIKECLENGGLIILSDADLTDISVDYIRSFCPSAPIFCVEYQGNPEPWRIAFHTGRRDEFLQEIFDWFDHDLNEDYLDPIHIFVDNKDEGQALEQILLRKYPELQSRIGGIIRIDSSVTQTDFGRKFVERPNKSIEELKPRVLISTQSLGVGVSIDIPWFKHVFGLCFGTSEPSQARQGLARVRQNVPRSIWAADKGKSEHGLRSSFFPEEIKNNLFNHHESTSELIEIAKDLTAQSIQNQCDAEFLPVFIKTLELMMGAQKSWDNPHLGLMAKFQARRNYSMSQFALQLRQELLDEGHDLTDFGCAEELPISEEMKEQKEENRLEESRLISSSLVVTEEEAKKININPSSTDAERRSATKTLIAKELPGIELTTKFIHRAYTADKGRWKNSVRLFWSCQNLEATRERDLATWRYKLKQFSEGATYIPDIKTTSLQCKALIESGIFEFAKEQKDSPQQFIDESPEIRGFLNWAEENKKLLQRAFGMKPGKSSAIRFVGQLLGKVGLSLKVSKTEKLPDNKKLRWYSLDTSLMDDPDRLSILEALDRAQIIRQEEKLAKEQAWLDQQAQAAQAPVSYHLKSQEGMVNSGGDTSTDLYNTKGTRVTAYEHCGEGATGDLEEKPQTRLEWLINAFSQCNDPSEFEFAIDGESEQMIEDAILYQEPSHRVLLRQWLEQMTQPLESVTGVGVGGAAEGARLVELLSVVSTAGEFLRVVQGVSSDVVEEAIASQDTQPKRQQLSQWYAAAEVSTKTLVSATRWIAGARCLSDAFIGRVCQILQVIPGLFDYAVIVPVDEPGLRPHTVSLSGLRAVPTG